MITSLNRNIVELEEIDRDIENLPEVIDKINNSLVEINFILRSLTLGNLDGEIKTSTIKAGETLKVGHNLGTVPKYRLILRNEYDTLIKDGKFTRNYVEFTNTGASDVTITYMLIKD